MIELSRVVQEREHHVEEVLAVGRAADVPLQEVRQRLHQPVADGAEAFDGAVVGEEPLAHPKGVRVVGAEVADRGATEVNQDAVRAHAARYALPIDWSLVELRTLLVEHLAALIEANSPGVGAEIGRRRDGLALFVEDVTEAIGAVRHVAQKTSIVFLLLPRHSERAAVGTIGASGPAAPTKPPWCRETSRVKVCRCRRARHERRTAQRTRFLSSQSPDARSRPRAAAPCRSINRRVRSLAPRSPRAAARRTSITPTMAAASSATGIAKSMCT